MASLILNAKLRILKLQDLLYLRFFSSHSRGGPANEIDSPVLEPKERWLNIKAGIFGPEDKRLPLPGNIGLSQGMKRVRIIELHSTKDLLGKTENMDKVNTLQIRSINGSTEIDLAIQSIAGEISIYLDSKRKYLECRVQKCPKLLRKDFQNLFPGFDMKKQNLTVITICQKTQFDMSSWSEEVELEREKLMEVFINTALKFCTGFAHEGYWSDFIDPSSGRPYYGQFVNGTLFETDERYRNLGYIIEDLGCCKVVSHRKWGSNIFLGSLFTNCPTASEKIENVLAAHDLERQPVFEK